MEKLILHIILLGTIKYLKLLRKSVILQTTEQIPRQRKSVNNPKPNPKTQNPSRTSVKP